MSLRWKQRREKFFSRSSFNSTRDITKLKEEIIFFRERTQDLLKQLKKTASDYETKKQEFSSTLVAERGKVSRDREKLDSYDSQLKELIKKHREDMSVQEEEYKKKVEETNRVLGAEKAKYEQEVDELTKAVNAILEFERTELELLNQEKNLREELLFENNRVDVKKREFQDEVDVYVEERDKLDDLENQIESERNNLKQTMKKENYLLEKKKFENQQKIDHTQKVSQKLSDRNKEAHMQSVVSKDCLSEYQSLNYKQAKKIKALKSELQYVKYRLSEELYKFSVKIEDLKKERHEIEDEYSDKLRVMEEHIEQKNRELRNLRFLSKATLHQKSILDTFLIESIDYAKSMAQNESEDSHNSRNPQNSPNPQNSQTSPNLPLQSSKIELPSLSWEDKEKVLRVLYSKISLGVTPGYWRHLEEGGRKRN